MTITSILMLAASPENSVRLRLDKEQQKIREGLERKGRNKQFKLTTCPAVRPIDVRRALLDTKPTIVHFSGHGCAEGLYLENEQGQAQLVSTRALSGLFELFASNIKCVVLNACYSVNQAKAIVQHIPFVIGMNQAITDKAAIEFAVSFYDALVAGESIEFAHRYGCAAIDMEGLGDYMTPTLERMNGDETRTLALSKKAPESINSTTQAIDNILQEISLWKAAMNWFKTNDAVLIEHALIHLKETKTNYYGRGLETEEDFEKFKIDIQHHMEWIRTCLLNGSDDIDIQPYLNKTTPIMGAYCTFWTQIFLELQRLSVDGSKEAHLLSTFFDKLRKQYC